MALAAPNADQMRRLMASRVRISRRVEVYEADQATLWRRSDSFGPLEGSVSVDASRDERRTFSLSVVPKDDSIRIGPGHLWYDKIIRPYWGFYDSWSDRETLWEQPLGDFMIDTIDNESFPSTITLEGRDLTKKLLTSTLPLPESFSAGTPVDTIVIAVCGNAGITNVILPWSETNPAPGLPLTQTFDADATRFSLLDTILISLGYEFYLDAYSRLVVRLFQDPATLAPAYRFTQGEGGNLIKISRRLNDSELYNHVVVRGAAEQNKTLFAQAQISDESSPAHQDVIGDRVYSFPTSVISDHGEALLLARNLLRVKSLESYEIGFSSITAPWLEGGDVVAFEDPDPLVIGEPENYFLSSFEIPLALGGMSGTFKRVVQAIT